MELSDLRKPIEEMSDDELRERLEEIRKSRRTRKTKTKAKASTKKNESDLDKFMKVFDKLPDDMKKEIMENL